MRDYINQNLATKEFVSKELSETKSELFQWMCFFWVTQMAVCVVMILLLLKK
jgi:hypothetical protein